jgi:hypothetical protein
LLTLSVQLRLIWVLETALAVRFVGAAGGEGTVSALRRTIGATMARPRRSTETACNGPAGQSRRQQAASPSVGRRWLKMPAERTAGSCCSLWVTADKRTSVTALIDAASGVSITKGCPYAMFEGAAVTVGLGPLNR